MANPFENQDEIYLILVNDENQYSLWPEFRVVPSGWRTIGPRAKRAVCLAWIENHWTDMRPKTLAEQMARNIQ